MEQIEITVRVKESLESAKNKLKKQGFKLIRESVIDDIYMTQLLSGLKKDNIQYVLSNSVLLRYLNENGKEIKKITYKNKKYDNGNVISEQKINLNCDDLETAKKLFEALKFEELVEVKYNVIVMKKGDIEFAFQNVENLGLLLEYENNNDFSNSNLEEINKEKNRMLEEIKEYGIEITDEMDVKKAWELIYKKFE